MPSERDIDNYINEIEEKNQIYMEEELEYAKKCHNLEEQLGCPLEVVFKALKNGSCGSIYTFIQNDYNGIYKIGLYKGIIINGLTRECNGKDFYFSCYDSLTYKGYKFYLKDYKKTWWLSETKEE